MKKKTGGYYLIKKFMKLLKKPTITATIRLDYSGLGMYRDWKKI
jgi:hypothetical protein